MSPKHLSLTVLPKQTTRPNTIAPLESGEHFRFMMDQLPLMVCSSNASGDIIFINKYTSEYTGIATTPSADQLWRMIIHQDDQSQFDRIYKQSIDSHLPFSAELRLKRRDGNFHHFLVSGTAGFLPGGNFAGYTWTASDIEDNRQTLAALKASKNEYAFAIEATQLGTWDFNPTTHKFSANQQLKEWFGLPADEEILLSHAVNSIHEKDRDRVTQAITRALEFSSGGNYDIEYKVINPLTKRETIVHVKGLASFNEENVCYRFNGTMEDVTEQATAALQIRESEQRLNRLIVSSPFAIGLLRGKDLVITTGNQPIIDIWGKGWDIIGKSYFEALPELAEQGYREIFENVYKTGEPFNAVEMPVNIIQDGNMQLRYYDFLLYAQRDVNGMIDGIGIIAAEVTSQALLNNQVKESEKRFRLLADAMPQHIWTSDAEGNLNYYNQSVYDYSGLSPEQVEKEGWLQIVHPDDRQKNIEVWMNAISSGNTFILEHRFRRYDGKYRWQLSRAVPHRDANGNILLWVGTSTDIEEMKEQDAQKDFYIAMVSHELKTPVTSIKGYAQVLQKMYKDKGDTVLNNSLNIIARQSGSLTSIISELLDVSKIKTGKLSLNIESFRIADLLKDVEEEIMQVNPSAKVSFVQEIDGAVNADRERMSQVMINLLTNAIKYSTVGGEVMLTSKIEDGNWKVSVHDAGIGIAKKDQERIFERFYRVEGNQEQRYTGFGIGLYISADIITRHHGKIGVNSEPGKGAEFYFSIPLVNSRN